MSDTTNISIGKNAPDWLADMFNDMADKGELGDTSITDFRKETPNIQAARDIEKKIHSAIHENKECEVSDTESFSYEINAAEKAVNELINANAGELIINAARDLVSAWKLFQEGNTHEAYETAIWVARVLDDNFQVNFNQHFIQSLVVNHLTNESHRIEEAINKALNH